MTSPEKTAVTPVVVLGHSGFIGKALMRQFENDRSLRVAGYAIPSIDLRDPAAISALAKVMTPETVVIMCAAIKRQAGDNIESYQQNSSMVVNLAFAIAKRPIKRLIFMSSAAVYGEDVHNMAIDDETPPHIRSYYGLSRLVAEHVLEKVLGDAGGELVCLRPPTIYGPFEETPSYGVGSFLRQAAKGGPITLWGDGTELRGMIFIDDVVEIIRRLICSPFRGRLNLVSPSSYTFKEALAAVQGAIQKPVSVEVRARTKQQVDNRFTGRRLAELMPDFNFTDLAAGVRYTFEREYLK